MAKGRKSGCPVNIKNWLISILDVGTENFVRIFGLNSMTRTVEGDTEDGSADTDTWEEPFVTKRSSSVELEGVKKVLDSTGEIDQGQEMLDDYGEQSGCDADCTLKFIDPYGHGWIADYIVTSVEESADDSENGKSWSLQQVGEAEPIRYVQVSGVSAVDAEGAPLTTVKLVAGGAPQLVEVKFAPDDASNTRFKVSNNKRSVVRIMNVTDTGFTIQPVGAGDAVVNITSINNAKKANVTVKVYETQDALEADH